MTLTPGARLGRYEVLSALGAGGMGEVYRARDTRLHRDVAIKVLPTSVAFDPERLARFEREAQLLASLIPPHVAAIHDLEESGATRALVMELVEGPTVAETLEAANASGLSLEDAIPIAVEIAEAGEAAHERGIIHRVLKPSNVKPTHDGHVRVLDFGLAKLADRTAAGIVHVRSANRVGHAGQRATAGDRSVARTRGSAAAAMAPAYRLSVQTSMIRTDSDFALSPEGRRLAYSALGSQGRLSLWVRALKEVPCAC